MLTSSHVNHIRASVACTAVLQFTSKIILTFWFMLISMNAASAQQSPNSPSLSQAVSKTTFAIEQVHRFAGKKNASAIFSFETSSFGSISEGGRITLVYPSGFFSADAIPMVKINNNIHGLASALSATSIVITTSVGMLMSNSNVTVLLEGLTMGSATASRDNFITISTSNGSH